MGNSSTVAFYQDSPPAADEVIEKTLAVCAEHDLVRTDTEEPLKPDDIGSEHVYRVRDSTRSPSKATTMTLSFSIMKGTGTPPDPFLMISVDKAGLGPLQNDHTKEEDAGFTPTLVDLIRDLAVALDPLYVVVPHPNIGRGGPDAESVLPMDDETELDRIPWVSVYSKRLLDRFGWTDRILDTPAWTVEQLDTGGVLLIKGNEPWANTKHNHPIDRYLIDGDDSVVNESE